MKKLNLTTICISVFIGISIIISVWLYRDAELRKIGFQMNNQLKIEDCISKVQDRYSKTAQSGAGILNIDEITLLKTQSNADEDRCINKYK